MNNFYREALCSENSAFFITVCCNRRMPLFAMDARDPHILSKEGQIASSIVQEIPDHFPQVSLDEFVVMPDHIHLILLCNINISTTQKFSMPRKGSLVTVIKSFKSAVTREINLLPNYQDYKVWQPGYYEHRIRNSFELQRIKNYIRTNPERWVEKYANI